MIGPAIIVAAIYFVYKALRRVNTLVVDYNLKPVVGISTKPDVNTSHLFETLTYLYESTVKESNRHEAAFQLMSAIENNSINGRLPEKIGVEKWDEFLVKYRRSKLEKAWLIPNFEPFTCSICLSDQAVGEGVHLQTCLHQFCKECLFQLVKTSTEPEIKCPFISLRGDICNTSLLQNEIRALVPAEDFSRYLERSLKRVECQSGNSFHCRTTDCSGWCMLDDGVTAFNCPVCDHINCVKCNAIHENSTCQEFRKLKKTDEASTKMLKRMLNRGEAMLCPKCKAIVQKRGGCDALKCSMCGVALCWATRGLRWGPRGRGDTSGGCKCSLWNRCHPDCHNCH